MKFVFSENLSLEIFQIEFARELELLAAKNNGTVYSWKTTGRKNWLEKGFSIVDVLGLTILPKDQPDWIDLPDDA